MLSGTWALGTTRAFRRSGVSTRSGSGSDSLFPLGGRRRPSSVRSAAAKSFCILVLSIASRARLKASCSGLGPPEPGFLSPSPSAAACAEAIMRNNNLRYWISTVFHCCSTSRQTSPSPRPAKNSSRSSSAAGAPSPTTIARSSSSTRPGCSRRRSRTRAMSIAKRSSSPSSGSSGQTLSPSSPAPAARGSSAPKDSGTASGLSTSWQRVLIHRTTSSRRRACPLLRDSLNPSSSRSSANRMKVTARRRSTATVSERFMMLKAKPRSCTSNSRKQRSPSWAPCLRPTRSRIASSGCALSAACSAAIRAKTPRHCVFSSARASAKARQQIRQLRSTPGTRCAEQTSRPQEEQARAPNCEQTRQDADRGTRPVC